MSYKLPSIAAVILTSAALCIGCSGASPSEEDTSTSTEALKPNKGPKKWTLAVGSGMAFGYNAERFEASKDPKTYVGYGELFAKKVNDSRRKSSMGAANFGCPDESAVTFVKGGCQWVQDGFQTHISFNGKSQLSAIKKFIKDHDDNDVSTILIDLGRPELISDVFNAAFIDPRWDGVDLDLLRSLMHEYAKSFFPRHEKELADAFRAIRDITPRGTEVIALLHFDAFTDFIPAPELWGPHNAAIAKAAWKNGFKLADSRPVFNAKPEPDVLCSLTNECVPPFDFNPNDAGFQKLADIFYDASSFDRRGHHGWGHDNDHDHHSCDE